MYIYVLLFISCLGHYCDVSVVDYGLTRGDCEAYLKTYPDERLKCEVLYIES